MSLIIVESPTKAKTFNRILKSGKNNNYFVFATFGHIRDLPKSQLAIDYQNNFKPKYEIISGRKKVVSELKKLAAKNKEIILATDLDREGESIAYHIAYILGFIKEKWPEFKIVPNDNISFKRIIFHEITPQALKNALNHPESLRINLVKAQQSRRILDRIVGYELSPLLWKIMGKNWLSAGRVQTVALRLVVEREKEINRFNRENYYQIYGLFQTVDHQQSIKGELIERNGKKMEIITKLQLFDGQYQYKKTNIDKKESEIINKDLKIDQFVVSDIKEKQAIRYPPPPYTTSLLQQDSFYRFGFSSKLTMKLAQDLYEEGLITYHRTDSFNLAASFLFSAQKYIKENFGAEYSLDRPRVFKTKSKSAQEAHEAIRPTNINYDFSKNKINNKLTKNHQRLYQIIFNRSLATQMKEAIIKTIKIEIMSKKKYLFIAEDFQVIFPGFLKILNPEYIAAHQQPLAIKINTPLILDKIETLEKTTNPPPRYNEASLIKSLEEKGIGRPSTYAAILSLIQDKNYVEKENRFFIPTKLGESIANYLSESFSKVFDLSFTAQMEDGLDQIAQGKKEMIELLNEFYQPFHETLNQKRQSPTFIDVEEKIDEKCPQCGNNLVVRYSRFGKFLACSQYPNCRFTKPFLKFVKDKLCPLDKGRITIRFTKNRKRFYGCENWPKCKYSAWKL